MQKTKKVLKCEDIIAEEDMQDVMEKLKQAEEEYERGEGIKAEVVFEELREKYGL